MGLYESIQRSQGSIDDIAGALHNYITQKRQKDVQQSLYEGLNKFMKPQTTITGGDVKPQTNVATLGAQPVQGQPTQSPEQMRAALSSTQVTPQGRMTEPAPNMPVAQDELGSAQVSVNPSSQIQPTAASLTGEITTRTPSKREALRAYLSNVSPEQFSDPYFMQALKQHADMLDLTEPKPETFTAAAGAGIFTRDPETGEIRQTGAVPKTMPVLLGTEDIKDANDNIIGYREKFGKKDEQGTEIVEKTTDHNFPKDGGSSKSYKSVGMLKNGLTVSYDPKAARNMVTEKDGTIRPYDILKDGPFTTDAEKSAQARGESYAKARMVSMLDTQNGNSPVELSAADINRENSDAAAQGRQPRYIPAGASQSALNKTALIEDIRGNIGQTRDALKGLKEDFPQSVRAKLAVALTDRDPRSAVSALISGELLGSLTEDQQSYVQSIAQLTENAMAMRSVLGAGQGSEELRQAIMNTIPNVLTPNRKYAMNQLQLFENTLNRLMRGVPQVPLRGGGNPQPTAKPAGSVPKISNDTEYDALPSGTIFIDPRGEKRKKP
jgi:hypothetical protein